MRIACAIGIAHACINAKHAGAMPAGYAACEQMLLMLAALNIDISKV